MKLIVYLLLMGFLSVFLISPNISQARKPMIGFSNHQWGTLLSKMPGIDTTLDTGGNEVLFYDVDINSYSFYGFLPRNIKLQNLTMEFIMARKQFSNNAAERKNLLQFNRVFFNIEKNNVDIIKVYLTEFYGEPEIVERAYSNAYSQHYIWENSDTLITFNVYKDKCTMNISAKGF